MEYNNRPAREVLVHGLFSLQLFIIDRNDRTNAYTSTTINKVGGNTNTNTNTNIQKQQQRRRRQQQHAGSYNFERNIIIISSSSSSSIEKRSSGRTKQNMKETDNNSMKNTLL